MKLSDFETEQLVLRALRNARAYNIETSVETIIFIIINVIEPGLDRRNSPRITRIFNKLMEEKMKQTKTKKAKRYENFGPAEFLAFAAPAAFYIMIIYVLIH